MHIATATETTSKTTTPFEFRKTTSDGQASQRTSAAAPTRKATLYNSKSPGITPSFLSVDNELPIDKYGCPFSGLADSTDNSSLANAIAGCDNALVGSFGVVLGGTMNTGINDNVVCYGGTKLVPRSNSATVAGGFANTASARFSTILGGSRNTVAGKHSVGLGFDVFAQGIHSMVFGFSGMQTQSSQTKSTVVSADQVLVNGVTLMQYTSRRALLEAEKRLPPVSDIRETLNVLREKVATQQNLLLSLRGIVQTNHLLQRRLFTAKKALQHGVESQ